MSFYGHYFRNTPQNFTSGTTFSTYLLIVDPYSKITKLYGREIITTDEVMDKFDMFQATFGKIDKSGWWDLEIISADKRTQFTSAEFQDTFQPGSVWIMLASTENQEMNRQVKVTQIMLRTIAHSLMVYARVSEYYIHFTLMYTADHISRYYHSKT